MNSGIFQRAKNSFVYAIIDGASVPQLISKLEQFHPKHVCLWRGELELELREVVPYVVAIRHEDEFTNWFLRQSSGTPWGVFVISDTEIHALAYHLRKLLMAELPNGKKVYFRFYDPRVLRAYLPSCTAEEQREFYGPIREFVF